MAVDQQRAEAISNAMLAEDYATDECQGDQFPCGELPNEECVVVRNPVVVFLDFALSRIRDR